MALFYFPSRKLVKLVAGDEPIPNSDPVLLIKRKIFFFKEKQENPKFFYF